MKTINIHNNTNINAEGKLNSKHCKPVICLETGEVFSSVTDAADAVGRNAQNLSYHLTGKLKSFAGRHYCYLSKATESLDAIVTRLRETSSMEDDARKWRAYQAEQEAIRKAEQKRIDDERKAKEQHEAAIAKAKAKLDRCTAICERLESELLRAEQRRMEAEEELRALTGDESENENVA
jgi:chromosome segregation ATPase